MDVKVINANEEEVTPDMLKAIVKVIQCQDGELPLGAKAVEYIEKHNLPVAFMSCYVAKQVLLAAAMQEANLSEAAGPSSANLRLTQVKECKSVLANPLEEDSLKFHAAVPCVQNDLLKGLSFKNVTFLHPPTHGWSCKYVAGDFLAKLVSPPLEC